MSDYALIDTFEVGSSEDGISVRPIPPTIVDSFESEIVLFPPALSDSKRDSSAAVVQPNELVVDSAFEMGKVFAAYSEIRMLFSPGYVVLVPIPLKLVYSEDGIIGEIRELELYSFADNEFEVIRELHEDIVDMYEFLINKTEDELGVFPIAWKNFLIEHVTHS